MYDHDQHHMEDVMVFVYPPSDNLLCPIHKGFFRSPVIVKCGHTFCKDCISSLQRCPVDTTLLGNADTYIPNLAVSSQIHDLRIHCRYGTQKVDGEWRASSTGCKEIIKLGARREHEDRCDVAPARCPYSSLCPALKRSNLQEHLSVCTHIPCAHRTAGCTFEGTKIQMEEHLTNCGYESIKDYIARNEEQLNVLKTQLDEKMGENDFLKKSIIQLTTRFDQLAMKLETKNSKFEATIRHLNASLEATQAQLSYAVSDIANMRKSYVDRGPDVVHDVIEAGPIGTATMLKCKGTITGHNGPVWALAVANGVLASGSSDTTVKVWDMQSFKCKATLNGHEGIVHSLAAIGNRLFSGSDDKQIRVWDLESNECIKTLEDHDNTVCALAVAAGVLFSGSYTYLKVWDLETYQCVETLRGHNHWVRAMTVSNGFLFSGSHNIIKIWDLGTFQCIKTITGNSGSIYSLAVAGRKLLAGTYENTILVWDLDTYEITHRLSGHIGAVYTLMVYGTKFYSGSYDSTIKVWNIDNMQCLQTLNRHTSSVDALVWSHGNIYSGSADNTLKVWR